MAANSSMPMRRRASTSSAVEAEDEDVVVADTLA